jgi:hypothetical protein
VQWDDFTDFPGRANERGNLLSRPGGSQFLSGAIPDMHPNRGTEMEKEGFAFEVALRNM